MNSAEAKIPNVEGHWQSIEIFLFSNGQQYSPPRKYHLRAEELNWWEATLNHLAQLHYGIQHPLIYLYTTDGRLVEGPLELKDGQAYVAVEPQDTFIDAGYQKYLIRAIRSWEKRQARKYPACEHEQPCYLCPEKEVCKHHHSCCLCPEKEEAASPEPLMAATGHPELRPPGGHFMSSVYTKPVAADILDDHGPRSGTIGASTSEREYTPDEHEARPGEQRTRPSLVKGGVRSDEYRAKPTGYESGPSDNGPWSSGIGSKIGEQDIRLRERETNLDESADRPVENTDQLVEHRSRPKKQGARPRNGKARINERATDGFGPEFVGYKARPDESEARSSEHGAGSSEHGTGSDEHGIGPVEHRARPVEHEARSDKRTVRSAKRGARLSKNGTKIGEDAARFGEQRTKPYEYGPIPVKSGVRSNERKTEPTNSESGLGDSKPWSNEIGARNGEQDVKLRERKTNLDESADRPVEDTYRPNKYANAQSEHGSRSEELDNRLGEHRDRSGGHDVIPDDNGNIVSEQESRMDESRGRSNRQERSPGVNHNRLDDNDDSDEESDYTREGEQRDKELETGDRAGGISEKGGERRVNGGEKTKREIEHTRRSNKQGAAETELEGRVAESRGRGIEHTRRPKEIEHCGKEIEHASRPGEKRSTEIEHTRRPSTQKAVEVEPVNRNGKPRASKLSEQKAAEIEYGGRVREPRIREIEHAGEQIGREIEQTRKPSKQRAAEIEHLGKIGEQRAREIEHTHRLNEQRTEEILHRGRAGEPKHREIENGGTASEQRGRKINVGKAGEQKAGDSDHGLRLSEQRSRPSDYIARLGDHETKVGDHEARGGDLGIRVGVHEPEVESSDSRVAEPSPKTAAPGTRASPKDRMNPRARTGQPRLVRPGTRVDETAVRLGESEITDKVGVPTTTAGDIGTRVVRPGGRMSGYGGAGAAGVSHISEAQQHVRRSSIPADKPSSEKKRWSVGQHTTFLRKSTPLPISSIPPKKSGDTELIRTNREILSKKLVGKVPVPASNEAGKPKIVAKYPYKRIPPPAVPPSTTNIGHIDLKKKSTSLTKIVSNHKSLATDSASVENTIDDKDIIIVSTHLFSNTESEIRSVRLSSVTQVVDAIEDSSKKVQTGLICLQQSITSISVNEGVQTHTELLTEAVDQYGQRVCTSSKARVECTLSSPRDNNMVATDDSDENFITILNKDDVFNVKLNIKVRNGGRSVNCCQNCRRSRSLTNVTRTERGSQISFDDGIMYVESKSLHSILKNEYFRGSGFEGHPKVVVVQCACCGRQNNPLPCEPPPCCDSKKYFVLLRNSLQKDRDDRCNCVPLCQPSGLRPHSQRRSLNSGVPVKNTYSDTTLETLSRIPLQMLQIGRFVTTTDSTCQTEDPKNECLVTKNNEKESSPQISQPSQAYHLVTKCSFLKIYPQIGEQVDSQVCSHPRPQEESQEYPQVCPQTGQKVPLQGCRQTGPRVQSQACSQVCFQKCQKGCPQTCLQVQSHECPQECLTTCTQGCPKECHQILQVHSQVCPPTSLQVQSQTCSQVHGCPKISRDVSDSHTQTQWCNVVLEARLHGDGRYSFHLPPLHVLNSYPF